MIKRTLCTFMLLATAAHAQPLPPSEQARIMESAAALLSQRYVDPAAATRIAAAIRRELAAPGGLWAAPAEPETFAKATTTWLRRIADDGHLGLSYSKAEITEQAEPDFSQEMDQWYGPGINHGIEKIERLPGNVMLLDLRAFPPTNMAGDVFAAAMTVVAQGSALIIDLRRNGGGVDSAQLITGYLLDGSKPLSGGYDRPSNTRSYNVSPSWVPGRRFGPQKPMYVLISRKTFSAAEALAYDLQALKRAVIVGETSGGGAHPFEYRRIHPHFAIDLPEGRSINPITGGNWQNVGVKPDVPVPADQALQKALELAQAAIAKP